MVGKHQLIERSDPCRPTLCALGTEPHAHCPCGLPMAVGATLCDLCRAEGLQRDLSVQPAGRFEWDGVSFPSLRLNRPADVPHQRYIGLLQTIFDPAFEQETMPTTAGEAA
jgi:hypothetical protein